MNTIKNTVAFIETNKGKIDIELREYIREKIMHNLKNITQTKKRQSKYEIEKTQKFKDT